MIYVAIIMEGGDFVATFLVYDQYFHYGTTVPHSGSNKHLNRLLLLRLRIRILTGVVTLISGLKIFLSVKILHSKMKAGANLALNRWFSNSNGIGLKSPIRTFFTNIEEFCTM